MLIKRQQEQILKEPRFGGIITAQGTTIKGVYTSEKQYIKMRKQDFYGYRIYFPMFIMLFRDAGREGFLETRERVLKSYSHNRVLGSFLFIFLALFPFRLDAEVTYPIRLFSGQRFWLIMASVYGLPLILWVLLFDQLFWLSWVWLVPLFYIFSMVAAFGANKEYHLTKTLIYQEESTFRLKPVSEDNSLNKMAEHVVEMLRVAQKIYAVTPEKHSKLLEQIERLHGNIMQIVSLAMYNGSKMSEDELNQFIEKLYIQVRKTDRLIEISSWEDATNLAGSLNKKIYAKFAKV